MSEEIVFLDATLRPNRSLSARAVRVVFLVALVLSVLCGAYFLAEGAYPVVGFFGLDVVALYIAFRMSLRDQAQTTHVRVTRYAVMVRHEDGRGGVREAELPTAFLRVEADEPRTPQGGIRLCLSERSYVLGRFLTVDERLEFTRVLERAVKTARTARP